MALLRQKLKMAGNLAGASAEETQQLAQAAGRTAAPTTPQETMVIGGSPDQAKMAGTPNQKVSALRTTIQQTRNLADVQRREQPRTQQTAQEAAAQAKGQKLEGLSGLQGRVQNLTKQMLTQGQQAAAPAALQVDQTKLSAIPPESQAEASSILQKLASNTATNADILKLNQLSGKTTTADMLTADQLKQSFMSTGATVGTNLAQATADTVSVSQLQPAELGFADMSELAATLGVPEEELGSMSLEQLQQQSQKLFEQEFNKVSSLEQMANDPNLGPAERAEARKGLKDAGATGVRSIESDADKLADQIATADEIEFNGEDIPVGDLLKDEMISGLAKRYLDAEEGDPFVEDFKENEPEMAEFFESNRNMLKQATAELDADVGQFAEIQQANLKVGELPDGPALSEDILKSILPDYGTLRDTPYDLAAVPTLQYLKDTTVPVASRNNVQAGLTEVAQTAPQLTASFAQLTPAELTQLGVTAGPGNPKWETTKAALKDVANANSMSAENPDTIAQVILGPGKTYQDLTAMANRITSMINSGLVPPGPMSKDLVAAIKAGPEAALAVIKAKLPQITDMRSLVANTPFSISEVAKAALTHADRTNPAFDVVAPYFENGRQLDLKAGQDILRKQGADALEVALASPAVRNRLSPGMQEKGEKLYRSAALPKLDEQLSAGKFYNTKDLDKLLGDKSPTLRDDTKWSRIDNALGELKKQLSVVDKKANPLKYKMLQDTLNKYKTASSDMRSRIEKEDTAADAKRTVDIAAQIPRKGEIAKLEQQIEQFNSRKGINNLSKAEEQKRLSEMRSRLATLNSQWAAEEKRLRGK